MLVTASPLKKTLRAAEQQRVDVVQARASWKQAQRSFEPQRLVFIDQTATTTRMARLYGRCRRGERLIGYVPHGHWKTTTFVAALRQGAVIAPWVVDGAINGDCFRAYVNQCLVPTLCHGDIVVMDNLASHKVVGVRDSIEATGAQLLYLPPYSPDFNPIEMVFAKLKASLRCAAERSIQALWKNIGSLLHSFSPSECSRYFAHAGYVSN